MIVSKYAFVSGDPGRVAAQIVSGIGFIGAGTILRDGFNVKGLTTAASLLGVACLGLVIGSGSYIIAIVATIGFNINLVKLKFNFIVFIKTSTQSFINP